MVSFNNMKVVYKIFTLVGFLSAVAIGIGYTGMHAAKYINQHSNDQDIAASELNKGHKMLESILQMDSMGNDIAALPTPEKIEEDMAIVNPSKKDFVEALKAAQSTGDKEQQEFLKKIDAAYKEYEPALDAIFTAASQVKPEFYADGQRHVVEVMAFSEDYSSKLQDAINNYIAYTTKDAHDVSEAATRAYETVSQYLLIGTTTAILLGCLFGFWIAVYNVSKPMQSTGNVLKSLIDGKLEVNIAHAERKDEIGDVARAAMTFKEVLIKNRDLAEAEKAELVKKEERRRKMEALIASFDRTATQTVSTVASASTQLSQTAEHMSKVAGETNQQSVEVASASEQASHNVQSVASAAEEMAATVQEISRQIALSNGIVRSAMDKATAADASSKELVEMSHSVGAIATLIEDIAGQINLLALNATIESARSGEAGKGFAVVANEVKNLANQTAKATEQIRQQLEAVQQTATGVAGALGEVREAIAKVDEGSTAIAAAVEQQSAATQEIVSNMNTATQGVEQINNGIFTIKGGTDSTTAATRQVLDAARMLSSQAEKMDKEVKTFLNDIVAA